MADADAVRGAGAPERLPARRRRRARPPTAPSPAGDVARRPPDRAPDRLVQVRSWRSSLGSVVGSSFADADHRGVLVEPLPAAQLRSRRSGPGDAFAIALRISVVVGIILAMPVLLYQLWAFVAPGPDRRRSGGPSGRGSRSRCSSSSSAWRSPTSSCRSRSAFLLAFTDDTIVAHLAAAPYFDFVTTMFLAFGLLMEFPIVLYALSPGRDPDARTACARRAGR